MARPKPASKCHALYAAVKRKQESHQEAADTTLTDTKVNMGIQAVTNCSKLSQSEPRETTKNWEKEDVDKRQEWRQWQEGG